VEPFFKPARKLRAGEGLSRKEQLVRLADGLRNGKIRQEVVYFDPAALGPEVGEFRHTA
jgi:hypothetical protein